MAPNPPSPCPRGHFSPPSSLLNKNHSTPADFSLRRAARRQAAPCLGDVASKKKPQQGSHRSKTGAAPRRQVPPGPGFWGFHPHPPPAPAPHLFSQSFIDPSVDRGLGSPQKSLEIIDISGDNKHKLSVWPSFLLKLQYSRGFIASRSVKNGARASGIRLLLP